MRDRSTSVRSASSSARVWRAIWKMPMNAKASEPQIATSLTSTTPTSGSSNPKPGPLRALLTALMLPLMLINDTYRAISSGVE